MPTKKFFLFDFSSAAPPIAGLTLRVRPRVEFYHLAADLSYATLPLKGAKILSLSVPVGQDCPHPLRDGMFNNNSI